VRFTIHPYPAGDYTVLVSAFEPHHMGPFSLRVESSHSFDVNAIPQEGAGMYSKTVRGAWCVQVDLTAMGFTDFGTGMNVLQRAVRHLTNIH